MKTSPDFSELDQARAELRRAELKLEDMDSELHILVQAVSGIYMRLGFDGTILSCKSAFSPQPRLLPDEPVGRRIQDVLPPAIAHQVLDGVAQVHQDQTSHRIEFILPVDGKRQDYEARLFPFIKRQVMALICNVAEPKQKSEWLTVNKRLSLLGQMAAGVAHELNNPLSVILGFAQSLSLHPQDSGSTSSSLKSIEREALRCKRLIQDLLIFSRSPKPRQTSEDVVSVLRGTLSLIEAQARIRHVEVMADFAVTLPPVVIDRHRIQQLIVNLCINAIDAMPRGGRLTVGLRKGVDVQSRPCVELFIQDTGVGIPTEILHRIYEPFFTTKDVGKGTGLGLSIVQDIVKEHRGSIEHHSVMGEGTTFIVKLPFSPYQNGAAQVNTQDGKDGVTTAEDAIS